MAMNQPSMEMELMRFGLGNGRIAPQICDSVCLLWVWQTSGMGHTEITVLSGCSSRVNGWKVNRMSNERNGTKRTPFIALIASSTTISIIKHDKSYFEIVGCRYCCCCRWLFTLNWFQCMSIKCTNNIARLNLQLSAQPLPANVWPR